jgi:hypothetical protein
MPRPFASPSAERAPGRTVYRPVGARIVVAGLAVIAGWWVVDLAWRGRLGEAVVAGLWLLAALTALGCVFWRPAVVVDDAAVELRNVVRDVRVPWSRLEDVTTRFALTLHAGGRRHSSWAGAAPGRPSVTRRVASGGPNPAVAGPPPADGPTASRDLAADSGVTAFLVEQGWRAWRDRQPAPAHPGGGPAEVEVRWRPVLPGVAVIAGLLAAALTPVLG